MERIRRRWHVASIVAAFSIGGCTTPATDVIVTLDTDVPQSRNLAIIVTVSDATGDGGTGMVRSFTRGNGAGAITLPASFGVVPGGGPRDASVVVRVDAHVDADATNPALSFSRVARFSFSPNVTAALPIFLAVSCATGSTECTSVPADRCTVSTRCEELGQTCGDRGECVPVDVMPVPITHPTTDAGIDSGSDSGVIAPPRLRAPMTATHLATQTPLLSWTLAPDTDGIVGQICRTADCATAPVAFTAMGESYRPTQPLAPGVWFWRVQGARGGVAGTQSSATWTFHVPYANTASDGQISASMDLNRDGYDDLAIAAPIGSGSVHLYAGGPAFVPTPVASLHTADSSMFGSPLARAGDVNGDGFSDVLATAQARGNVWLYFGEASATLVNAMPARVFENPEASTGATGFGGAIAGIGDVNGDGFGDVAIATTGLGVYVYYGSANGPAAMPDLTLRGTGMNYFGESIAESVDVNGDGLCDLVVGARGLASDPGGFEVFLGSRAGLPSTPTMHVSAPTGEDRFPTRIANAGDLDGDGRGDIVVGDSDSNKSAGRVFVYLGTDSGVTTVPMIDMSGPIGSYNHFGMAIASVSDFDHDGFDDVAIGSIPVGGLVQVFHGGRTTALFSAPISLTSVPTSQAFGSQLAGEADLDGNGYPEIVAGAPGENGSVGRAYVYAADASGFAAAPWRTLEPVDQAVALFGLAVR